MNMKDTGYALNKWLSRFRDSRFYDWIILYEIY